MKTIARTADDLIGTYRKFGEFGPLYQVIRLVSPTTVHILVVETGEETDYLVERALNDPEAD